MICRLVTILRQVDVAAFGVLLVVVVCCPKKFDGVNIANEGVQLGEVEIIVDTKVNNNLLVLMKSFE